MTTPTGDAEHGLFFELAFDALGVVGDDGHFKRVNPAFQRALGYTEAELCARPLVEFLHPDDVAKTKQGLAVLTSGTPTRASINRYRCKDGAYKWFSWNTAPVGPLFYTVGRDITAQVEADERIRQLNAQLELANRDLEARVAERVAELKQSEAQVLHLQKMDAVGRLAGGIAHDFNNMLGVVALCADVILDGIDRPEVVRDSVAEISAAIERASALTRQLLLFSRKQLVAPQRLELTPLIVDLERMLTRLLGDDIALVTRLADDLAPVYADPSQMEQVLLNLVVNAKDALPRGGQIVLETRNVYLDEAFTSTHLSVDRGPYVRLSVLDDGEGMDRDTLGKIFEPFFTTKPTGKGAGLGLATTYGIVKQCQGTIWVYSEPGKGTVFHIYLPVAEARREEPALAPGLARPPVASGTQTLLLAEDDERLRAGFALALERQG
jgi:PAS domain S-box-containing protein